MIQELLNKLPSSWEHISLKQFQSLTSTPINEDEDVISGIENTLAVISKLTDTPVDDLEALPMYQIQQLGDKLNFMLTPPVPALKSSIQWKTIEEISFNDYISFIQLQDKHLENLHVFIKNFSTTKLTEDEILQLPITEVLAGFFLFQHQLKKYLMRLIKLTLIKLIKQLIVEKLKGLKRKMKMLRKKYLSCLDGIS